jgi:hypothetical protein
VVIEAGVAAGYVIAWAVRRLRPTADRAGAEVDTAVDPSLDKLHAVVVARLGGHPVLDDLAEEAAAGDGQVSELTRQQVELALTAAARKDDRFGQELTDLLAQVRAAERAAGASVVAGAKSVVFTGDAHADARDDGIATFRADWRCEVPWHAHTDDRRMSTCRPDELAGGAIEQEVAEAA